MDSEILVNESVDHLFRHDIGQMISVLTRIFGMAKLDLVEDALQVSLMRALNQWTFKGIPKNPKAWLIQVAKNHMLDRLRRDNKSVSFENEFRQTDEYASKVDFSDSVYFKDEIFEDQLQMIFACCHHSIPIDSQIALTLKTVGGFSVTEISNAFLAKKDAIAKMVVRAKKRLKDHSVSLEIPGPEKIPKRLSAVLKVLYLMFNEGYTASAGDELVRTDLCYEAIRLTKLLAKHRMTSQPKVNALMALFLFQASRLHARRADDGALLILAEQDRSLWNKQMIGEGLRYFRKSASGNEVSEYHLEAEIASYHVLSKSFSSTDWKSLIKAYEELLNRKPSPIVALNKAFAVSQIDGAEAALIEIDGLKDKTLTNYYPFHITKGELFLQTGKYAEAIKSYKNAIQLTNNEPIKRFVRAKIKKIPDK